MKFLPLIALLLLLSCNGEPDSIYETDKSDTLIPPPPAPAQENVNDTNLNVEESGESLEGVDLYYCNIGIYQEPAILVIESEVTDEINGGGDWAEVGGHYFYVKIQKI
jgi:hypothetical protein